MEDLPCFPYIFSSASDLQPISLYLFSRLLVDKKIQIEFKKGAGHWNLNTLPKCRSWRLRNKVHSISHLAINYYEFLSLVYIIIVRHFQARKWTNVQINS